MAARRAFAVLTLVLATSASRLEAQRHAPAHPDSALVAQERGLYDAFTRHDADAFNRLVGSDFTFVDGSGTMPWARAHTAELMSRCTLAQYHMDDVHAVPAGKDVRVVTYKWTGDETCAGTKTPSPAIVMSVWRRQNGRWVAVSHSETPATNAPR